MAVFSPTQLSAIQETESTSVNEALRVFNNTLSPRTLKRLLWACNRPLEKSLEDKTLRSEYIDFCLLLPNFMYRSQTPALQLRHDDLFPGSQGSPLTLVQRKKPVIDTFQKWLDTFYCLRAGDRRGPPYTCLRVNQIPANYQQSSN